MKKLANKVALITGGSSGIGLATAKLMIAEGAKVIIVGRGADKLAAASKELGGDILTISADVSSISEIEGVIEKVKETYGHIDVLFANAGMSDCPPIFETDEAFFDKIINLNIKGVFFLFTKAFPIMAPHASVILTSSVAHGKGRPGDPVYSMTKAAVRSFGRTLALDEQVLAKQIRVNTLSPGTIETPLTKQDSPEMETAINEYIKASVPMQRWGRAEEVAKGVVFLASEDSSYMTGGDIYVDGGLAQI